MFSIDTITTFADFMSLREPWNSLVEREYESLPFLYHEWFQCCWKFWETIGSPFVLVVKDSTQTVGFIPMVQHWSFWHRIPIRTIQLLDSPDTLSADFIVQGERRQAILEKIFAFLWLKKDWHVFILNRIAQQTVTHHILRSVLHNKSFRVSGFSCSPLLEMDFSFEEFLASRSQRLRKTLRNITNRLNQLGHVAVRQCSGIDSVEATLDTLRRVESSSWKEGKGFALTGNPRLGNFFRDLTQIAASKGWLCFWVLEINGRPVATEYHLLNSPWSFALRGDFDQQYQDVSPGAYLNYHIIKTYITRGIQRYDMGPGEAEYKTRWATGTRVHDTFWVCNQTSRGQALFYLENRVIQKLKGLKSHSFSLWRSAGGIRLTERPPEMPPIP